MYSMAWQQVGKTGEKMAVTDGFAKDLLFFIQICTGAEEKEAEGAEGEGAREK